ncbi:MAG: type II secretion system protein GspD [Armatimonadota bacterium]
MEMTRRIIATAILGFTVIGTCVPACAVDQRANVRHEKVYLLQADARDVARMFGVAARARSERAAAARRGPIGRDATPDPSRQPKLVAWAGFPEQLEQFAGPTGGLGVPAGGGLSELLPGEMGPPIPLPGQNALLVTGTPSEIDAFRDVVRLIDVPQPHVRVRADIVNVLARIEEALGLDLSTTSGPVDVGTTGNVPPGAGIALRFGTANLAAAVGAVQARTRGHERVGAEVMTMTNVPALIRAGVTVPYFVPETIVTQGVVATNYVPLSAFVGMELYVLPRVNADDTVTMHIRPSLIDDAGTVLGPGGAAAPITRQTLTDVLIRVRDGETVCIGGLPRRQNMTNTTPLGTRQTIDDSELLVFVTPTILRPITRP